MTQGFENMELLEEIRKIVREEVERGREEYKETGGVPYQEFTTDQINLVKQRTDCLHDGLPKDAVHLISCPCPKCSPGC